MCGISGCIIKNVKYLEYLNKYNDSLIKFLHNRGPDQNGIFVSDNISLNHNRLSINDLDPRSKQPFYFKNFIMVFNGEIYNFLSLKQDLIDNYEATFVGTSDSEVLIQLFYYKGINKTLEMINGIFALALYDSETNDIYIIRDRIGIKYCYVYEDENILMFSSNPGSIAKTLYEINGKKFTINEDVMFSYIASGICLASKSMFNNINGVNPGTYIKINSKNLISQKEKWWEPNLYRDNENILDAIKHSMEIQELGDVDKNILYSGGIDSNIVAKFSTTSDLVTLAVGEEVVAKQCACTLNKKIKIIEPCYLEENLGNFISEQRKIINFSGIPIKASFLMNMTGLYLNENEPNSKILLTGTGGNELFYGHRRIKVKNEGFKSHVRDLYLYLSQIKPLDNKYKESFHRFKCDFANKLYEQIDIPKDLKESNISRWLEIQTFLLNDLLINADNIYMYYSIEARVPLLDHNIFEIALSKNPDEFFYDFENLGTATWNEYTTKSKKHFKEALKEHFDDKIIFKEKYSYDIERHKIHPYYVDLCQKFLERKIIGWNGAFTKYNSHLVGNIELWFQEFEYLLE